MKIDSATSLGEIAVVKFGRAAPDNDAVNTVPNAGDRWLVRIKSLWDRFTLRKMN